MRNHSPFATGLIGLGLMLVPLAGLAASGAQIYKEVCSACHQDKRGPDMLAPPIFGVVNHYKRQYPGRDQFIEQVSQWLLNPDEARSLMPGAIKRFKLMPYLGLDQTKAQAVAAFLFDADLNEPDWYRSHYEAEHGKGQ